MDDFQLLRDYAVTGSETAFAELTKRYVNLVYSAARRQVSDPHLAEEISQAVFILLARKANSIGSSVILSGWLLRTTQYTAANALRTQTRRHHYEEQAMANNFATDETREVWEQIEGQLDEALVSLREKDRAVVALRFFEKKSFREIANAMGTTEDNAQKRVARAVEKLRAFFKGRGCSISAVALTAALMANSVQSAPLALGTQVLASAVGKGTVTAAVSTQVAAVLTRFARLRLMTFAGVGAVVVSLLITGAVIFSQQKQREAATNAAETKAILVVVQNENNSNTLDQPVTNIVQFKMRVIDATNVLPVANVRLTLEERSSSGYLTNVVFTDRNGFAFLPRPREQVASWNYRIEVYRDGYVPKYVSWSAGQGDLFEEFPSDYVIRINRGTRIGGVVVNQNKEPISNAEIVFGMCGEAPGTSLERERLTQMSSYHREQTDAQGHWSCDHVPLKFGDIQFTLHHPEHQSVRYAVDAPENPYYGQMSQIAAVDLLAGKAEMKMRTGWPVSGVVVDVNDLPISGAQVENLNYDRYDLDIKAITDISGRFYFKDSPLMTMKLFVRAENFAPTEFEVNVRREMEPVRLVLAKGGQLRGRVVDESGQSINAARIELDPASGERTFFWKTTTDTEGRFEWNSAALTEQSYGVGAVGHKYRKVKLLADGAEHTITLQKADEAAKFKPVRVRVHAVDAETKKPLENFQIFVSQTQDQGLTSTLKAGATGNGGSGNFTVSAATASWVTEVRAPGHTPLRQTNSNTGREVLLNFELEKGASISGVVQLPNGQAVVNARVVLTTTKKKPWMQRPGILLVRSFDNLRAVDTDQEGEFSFEPTSDAVEILVAHELGFARISLNELETTHVVTLQPCGRVEGFLKLATQSVSNRTIILQSPFVDSPLHVVMRIKTGSDGHFVFENIPPGEYQLGDLAQFMDGKLGVLNTPSHNQPITVRPGETTQAMIGGTGRTVTGRLNLAGLENVDWQHNVNTLDLKVGVLDSKPVFRKDFRSDAEFNKAQLEFIDRIMAFGASEEGRKVARNQRQYVLVIDRDGAFSVDSVPPGEYTLKVGITKLLNTVGNNGLPSQELIGSLKRDIVIPEGDGSAAVGLGSFELEPAQ